MRRNNERFASACSDAFFFRDKPRRAILIESKWTYLTADEAEIILNALSSIRGNQHTEVAKIDALIDKLDKAESQPNITIGIYRGQVHWTRGNPFPIRICDYDGFDLPDVDERGKPCEITWEPADEGVEDD
ncbi:MAG TPA: hypothetical protein VKP67_25820 [Xanthobacteraceae bacterium]|nr:hypothetical protein [Xanthobacteraceae bacterium]